jgi:hypothetical protein
MIQQILQIAATVTVGVVMGLSLAHTLELPGKRRLNREQYLAVQTIYYPGFTIGWHRGAAIHPVAGWLGVLDTIESTAILPRDRCAGRSDCGSVGILDTDATGQPLLVGANTYQ